MKAPEIDGYEEITLEEFYQTKWGDQLRVSVGEKYTEHFYRKIPATAKSNEEIVSEFYTPLDAPGNYCRCLDAVDHKISAALKGRDG